MRLLAFLVFSVLVVTSASAQSLAEVARQESERRQAVPAAGKAYSNKDLRPTRAATAAVPPGVGGDASTPASAATAPDAVTPAPRPDAADVADATETPSEKTADIKDEKYWNTRMADLRARLERDQMFLQALQSRVDALTTDFVNRDDPAQRGQIESDRKKALAELERLHKAVEADKKAIPELEDDARRSGVPAGWLR